MIKLLAIAAGGTVGALLRFWMSSWVYALAGRGFPYGTLAVNVLGCLVMGLLYVWLVERTGIDGAWRAGLLIGVLGAFTTFSSFTMETMALIEGGEMGKALFNVLLSVTLCLLANWAGIVAGRWL